MRDSEESGQYEVVMENVRILDSGVCKWFLWSDSHESVKVPVQWQCEFPHGARSSTGAKKLHNLLYPTLQIYGVNLLEDQVSKGMKH